MLQIVQALIGLFVFLAILGAIAVALTVVIIAVDVFDQTLGG